MSSQIGANRLGIRLSPVSPANDSKDSNPQALLNHVVEQLDPLGLVYLHIFEGATGVARNYLAFDYEALHKRFSGTWMVNNGYDRAMALSQVASKRADLVSFGRAFISNPDLVARLQNNMSLAQLMGRETLYGGGAHSYTDYTNAKY